MPRVWPAAILGAPVPLCKPRLARCPALLHPPALHPPLFRRPSPPPSFRPHRSRPGLAAPLCPLRPRMALLFLSPPPLALLHPRLPRMGPPPGRVPPMVATASRVDRARAVQAGVEQVLASAARGFAPGAAQAIQEAMADLFALPARALTDTSASRGRIRRVVASLWDFLDGELVAYTSAPSLRGGSTPDLSSAASSPHKTAARVHHHLALGGISRAARALEALPLAPPTAATLALQPCISTRLLPTSPPPLPLPRS
jgi:hypothetical protein